MREMERMINYEKLKRISFEMRCIFYPEKEEEKPFLTKEEMEV